MLAENQEHRYRFTLAHEAAGHAVLHRNIYTDNKNTLYNAGNLPWIQCRKDNQQVIFKAKYKRNPHDWLEWQANTLGSIVLMPRESIFRVLKSNNGILKTMSVETIRKQIDKVVDVFNVSATAARIRLEKLGIIKSFYNQKKYINYSHAG